MALEFQLEEDRPVNIANGNTVSSSTDPDPPAAVPLPGALPLFATGLGALGLLGWRRKRKVV